MLEEIVTAYEDYGIDSILEASQMRFHESRKLKEAGSADWWRVSFWVLVILDRYKKELMFLLDVLLLIMFIAVAISLSIV